MAAPKGGDFCAVDRLHILTGTSVLSSHSSLLFSSPASRIPCSGHPRRPVPMVWPDQISVTTVTFMIATAVVSSYYNDTRRNRQVHPSACNVLLPSCPSALPFLMVLLLIVHLPSCPQSPSLLHPPHPSSFHRGGTTRAYRCKAGVTPA